MKPSRTHTRRPGARFGRSAAWLLSLALGATILLSHATSASAAFGIADFNGEVSHADGTPFTQAGGHPFEASTTFRVNEAPDGLPDTANIRDAIVQLPPGFVGNPSAVPIRCTEAALSGTETSDQTQGNQCPASAQIGRVTLQTQNQLATIPLYLMEDRPGIPAEFGFNYGNHTVFAQATLRSSGDYGVTINTSNISQAINAIRTTFTLWGVPADPRHDAEREGINCFFGCSTDIPLKPFLTNPANCSAGQLTTSLDLLGWNGDADSASFDTDVNGVPMRVENCATVPFDPSLSLVPSETRPDSPTGLEVRLAIPQNDNPLGVASAQLKRASITLPEGMSISPAAADGLMACDAAQLARETETSNPGDGCPNASKIGTVTATTPLLSAPLQGSVFVGDQRSDDPESGDMLRTHIVLQSKERGVVVRLTGQVRADSQTGRLEATFDNNPQLPVDTIEVKLKGGPRAALATPPTCGPKPVSAQLTSWSGKTVNLTDSVTFGCPGFTGFSPAFRAGPVNPVGGAFSPFAVRIARADQQQYLDGLTVDMPTGVLARLRGVPLCPEAKAAAGTCGVESRVGSATVAAGPGSNPFYLKGQPVYLAGPYKGEPYSLSVAARAVAGPFDLGTIVVRERIHIDPTDAHLTITSDPLPTIFKGVPLRLRSVAVDVDRPGFTLNPTSCAAKTVIARFHSQQGSESVQPSPFQVGDCQALPLKPKLALALSGRGQLTDGKHPGFRAVLVQGSGQAGLKHVAVKLPLSLALDPENAVSDSLCSFEESRKAEPKCPASSVVGTAKAWTPLLNRPVEGPVFFAKNVRVDAKSGRQIRALPKLVIPLRGEVALNLVGTSATTRDGRLVNTFATVPDAPVSRFELSLKGGSKGILVVNGNACKRSRAVVIEIDGQNGKTADRVLKLAAPCAKASRARHQPKRGIPARGRHR